MIKLLIGGSPCTYWSIAQKNGRETEAEGMGWELFKNYLIAKEKFKPDFFLYENNKSAAQAIKDQISRELGVDLMYINSALVSAQNRQRFYAFNWEVEQPEDRGILLKDILESGVVVNATADGKAQCLRATCYKDGIRNMVGNDIDRKTCVAEKLIKVCEIGKGGQGNRVYSVDGKSVSQTATSGGIGSNTGLYAVPVTPCGTRQTDKARCLRAGYATASQRDLLEDIKTNGQLGTTGAIEEIGYATPIEWNDQGEPTKAVSGTVGKIYTVYKVINGYITIKGGQYPIRLKDGYYIIRKLTVKECCRLQTMPDDYCKAVSDTQAYKALGNGWTAEVIIHILWNALKNIPKHEQIVVLSMYDGIGTGRYCLDKMGFTNVKYFAYEIDKYAMQVALSNYPDIIELGDAFQLRQDNWKLPKF